MDTHEVYEKEGSKKKKNGITIFGHAIPQTIKFWKRVAFFSKIGFAGSLVLIVIFQNFIPIFALVFFGVFCVMGMMRS